MPCLSPFELAVLAVLERAAELATAEGLDARASAAFCGISESKWRSLDASGWCPSPANLGDNRCPRWSRGELVAWLRAGAPSRARWVLMRNQIMRRVG
jgi:hypothetical protein